VLKKNLDRNEMETLGVKSKGNEFWGVGSRVNELGKIT
jgi:hypothetical protein